VSQYSIAKHISNARPPFPSFNIVVDVNFLGKVNFLLKAISSPNNNSEMFDIDFCESCL
jgi:hypothetical protein